MSGHTDPTVIPGKVTTKLSLRIVPDQDLETVSRALVAHLDASFDAFRSPNTLSVRVPCPCSTLALTPTHVVWPRFSSITPQTGG